MKNNLKYFIVLISLILISVFVYYLMNQNDDISETQFAVSNINEVYKIEMSTKFGNKITLDKRNSQWVINNNYPAEKYKIDNFFNILNILEVVSNINSQGRNRVIQILTTNSIRVSIYDKNNKEIKTFYAGGDASSKGAFMILEKDGKIAENPYIVSIPGFRGQLMYNFPMDSIYWRSTKVFDKSYELLSSITVAYEKETKNSFTINIDEDEIVVKPMVDSIELKTPIDREKVIMFLTEIGSKHFEYYDNEDTIKPSILAGKPRCTITTKSLNGEIKFIKMYDMPIHERSYKIKDEKGDFLKIDEERFYGVVSGRNDFVVAQYYVFGVLLKNYAYFFKKEKT